MNPFSLLFPLATAMSPVPPVPPATPTPVATEPSSSQWVFKSGASEIEIHTEGNVTFDPASEAIFDLHGDGTLRVREKKGKEIRLLTAQRDEVIWSVNGATRPFDAEGKAWLRRILNARPAVPTPPTPPQRRK